MHYFSTAPADYTGVFNEHLTFTSSSSSQLVLISIEEDTAVENSEMFFVNLSVDATLYSGVRLSPDMANVTIIDNDGKRIDGVRCVFNQGLHTTLHIIKLMYA